MRLPNTSCLGTSRTGEVTPFTFILRRTKLPGISMLRHPLLMPPTPASPAPGVTAVGAAAAWHVPGTGAAGCMPEGCAAGCDLCKAGPRSVAALLLQQVGTWGTVAVTAWAASWLMLDPGGSA